MFVFFVGLHVHLGLCVPLSKDSAAWLGQKAKCWLGRWQCLERESCRQWWATGSRSLALGRNPNPSSMLLFVCTGEAPQHHPSEWSRVAINRSTVQCHELPEGLLDVAVVGTCHYPQHGPGSSLELRLPGSSCQALCWAHWWLQHTAP